MTDLVERAVLATGVGYEVAEEAVLRRATTADLATVVPAADPFAQLLITTLRSWRGKRPRAHAETLSYLAAIEDRMAQTAAGSPSPTGVANDVSERVGAAAVDLLALRLVKCPHWPRWKTFGALLYLSQHKRPAATPALLRFAVETTDDEARAVAVEAIRETVDPELTAKMAAEERHQLSRGRGTEVLAVWRAIRR